MSLLVDIEKRLGDFHLRVKLDAADAATALLGASGSGKSVTLQCIAGIMTPDRGRIELNGRTLYDSEKGVDLPPQKRRVGYLFQQYALFPNMTVEENILCGVREGTRGEKREAVREALRRFRLEGLEKRRPARLSGGQQQRAALARILCGKPQAILLDEPFSSQDAFLKWNLEQELTEFLASFDGPILWVTHDGAECRRNCARVCVLEDGRSGETRGVEAFFAAPATVCEAKIALCRSFLRVQMRGADAYLPAWDATLAAEKPCSVLGVPPEAVVLGEGELRGTVVRVIPNGASSLVLLRPRGGAETAETLCAELPAGAVPDREVALRILPERCWYLNE
ncbi:MAG: ATP-binding cassette domain-containing protein [Oscillibacter sp.]|nr:ATP-binding cassette domain-containing protein [Oscillibacter sp.]